MSGSPGTAGPRAARPIRAHVERHGQGHGRIQARGRGVQRQLADRDGHAARALIAQAQDALVVSDHDQAHVGAVGGLAQNALHAADVIWRQPDAARPAQDVAELLAGAAHGGRVHDRHELFEVLRQQPVEERLVAVLERGQTDVLLEVVGLAADVLELERDLLLDRRHARGQQPTHFERVALRLCEGGVLVEQPMTHQLAAALAHGSFRTLDVLGVGRRGDVDHARSIGPARPLTVEPFGTD